MLLCYDQTYDIYQNPEDLDTDTEFEANEDAFDNRSRCKYEREIFDPTMLKLFLPASVQTAETTIDEYPDISGIYTARVRRF